MQIPNKFDPIALKDLMDFPYKENLFAYYYKGKFYLAPNRSYDELAAMPPGPTIIVHSIDNVDTRLMFGHNIHPAIGAIVLTNTNPTWNGYYFTSAGWVEYHLVKKSTLKNAIFGGGCNGSNSAGYCYGYYPDNFNLSNRWDGHDVGIRPNAATNVKFGCCFDRKLSKAEFDEVARWILRTQP